MKKLKYLYSTIVCFLLTSCINDGVWEDIDIFWITVISLFVGGLIGILVIELYRYLLKKK